MNLLITGATGFVGRHLVPELIRQSNSILEITRSSDKSIKLFGNKINRIKYDKSDHEALVSEVENFQPDICIHLASYLTANDDLHSLNELIESNVKFTCIVLDALKNTGLQTFINTGSFAEYFNGDGELDPAYLYTATKTASRIFVDYYSKSYGFNYFTIAPYTIYGGKDTQKKIIDIIYDSLDSPTAIDLTPGDQILDFIHINDVVNFYTTAVKYQKKVPSGTSFQLGFGMGHTLKELALIMEKKTGRKANINWGGRQYRTRDVMFAKANTSQQYHLFGWRPSISLDEGVQMYLEKKKYL